MRLQHYILRLNRFNRLIKPNNTVQLCSFSTDNWNFDDQLLDAVLTSDNKFKGKLTHKNFNSNTLCELEEKIQFKRPNNELEVSIIFEQLGKFLSSETPLALKEFFENNKLDTAINAHILGETSSIESIIVTSTTVANLFGSYYGNFENLNKTNKSFILLQNILNKCYLDIQQVSFSQLPMEKLVPLYFVLHKYGGEFINPKLMDAIKERVILHVNNTTSIDFILGLLGKVKLTPDQSKIIFNKARELLPNLSLSQSVSLIHYIAATKERPIIFLQEIAQHMELKQDEPLSSNQLVDLASALNKLSFSNSQILKLICKNLPENIKSTSNASKLSTVFSSLSSVNCGNKDLWELMENWLNKNYKELNIKGIIQVVISFSKLNLPAETIKVPLNYFNNTVTIKNFDNSNILLRYVYGMAIFGKMTPRMAESILKKEFVNDLLYQKPENMKMYLLNLIAQIDCAARNELNDFDRSKFSLKKYIKTDTGLINEITSIIYDKKAINYIELANSAIQRILGSQKKCSGPRLIQDAFLVNNIFTYIGDSEIGIVNDWDKLINSNDPKIGFVFISNRHVISDIETGVGIREAGAVSFKIRVLEKMGFKIIRLYESEFQKNSTAAENVDYVKKEMEKILGL
ncbi:Hypothetical protein SRAE_2000317300 [Strongyloides ratti]|uniref:RAP domain-containing protein n=1 Tax=Strongyloides ratti TaxID=34506 RepID=A0A090LFE5_STRRB|nr:Hypothetical protein SRAE_2000317300 [Strongyloides ratti]CEF68516.1 Hypothetical protein SRAE_2000317300 [Strongyloides ratti]